MMFYFRFYFAKIREWNGKSRWSRNGIKLLFLILKRVPFTIKLQMWLWMVLQDIEKIPFECLRSIRDWSIYCKWSLNHEQQNHWLNNNNLSVDGILSTQSECIYCTFRYQCEIPQFLSFHYVSEALQFIKSDNWKRATLHAPRHNYMFSCGFEMWCVWAAFSN